MLAPKNKNDAQDNLIEEFLREKAAVLSRAGMAVEEVLLQLAGLEREIEEMEPLLNISPQDEPASESLRDQEFILEEINSRIDKFNAFHRKAQTQFYYLIVTREALGLRRHELIQEIYRIPEKKKRYGKN